MGFTSVAKAFNIIAEEKQGVHFHIWIMPRYDWMNKFENGIMANIKNIFDYARQNLKNQDTFDKIKEITDLLKKEL